MSGQRRVPVLVDGDDVVVESRRVVRHLYTRYGDDSFARSIAELDRDILADGDAPAAGEACEVCRAPAAAGEGFAGRPVREDVAQSGPTSREHRMAARDTRFGGIGLGGIIVIIGIILMFVWSFWIGLIIALVGLIAFGGFVRGKWY